ncbi:hypothetical protein JL722_10967 [Aureococcus anophagefferens]|nr:hypothetical protein JL722_10967 [Aureococcus anophagefferens]
MALVADQLWSRGAKGSKVACRQVCGYNGAENHDGDDPAAERPNYELGHAQAQGRQLVLRGLGGGHGHVPFEKSRFYSAFQAEYPGRVGLDIFPFIPPLACVDDPAHMGLSLCAKGARDTVVAFRAARYALADISDYHERVRNAEAGAAGLMGELIENYMKPLKVSLDPAALVFGDRLTYAASVGEVTLGDAARHCSAYKVSGAQLTAIIGKRLKLIGREVRILFTHHILVEEAMAKPEDMMTSSI